MPSLYVTNYTATKSFVGKLALNSSYAATDAMKVVDFYTGMVNTKLLRANVNEKAEKFGFINPDEYVESAFNFLD